MHSREKKKPYGTYGGNRKTIWYGSGDYFERIAVNNIPQILFKYCYLKDDELNQHLSDGLLSIFINVSSENPKYLVFYEDENYESAKEDTSNDDNKDDCNSSASTSKSVPYNPKRAKLDYDAFTKRLRSVLPPILKHEFYDYENRFALKYFSSISYNFRILVIDKMINRLIFKSRVLHQSREDD